MTEIYLVIPPDAEASDAKRRLTATLARTPVAAVLLARGDRSEADYRALIDAVIGEAQGAGAAVLIEGEPALVRQTNADGLHVSGGIGAVRAAISALKPDLIVGAGDIRTRHDAMQKAELELDYILFGPLSGPISPEARELARWWAETMEIPSVLSDPQADLDRYNAEGCEFVGLNVLAGAPA
jgi:thiamine-phosphate pyrophosphorylase